MEQIIQSGSVIRGWLGVSMQDMTQELAESFNLDSSIGTLVASVLKDGPADKAGIKPGDILIAVEGKPVKNSSETLNLVAALPPGDTVIITVIRNKKERSFPVKVGMRPKQR
jgi:serine protease DegQ